MAAQRFTDDAAISARSARGARRSLAVAWFLVFLTGLLIIAAIAFLGNPQDGEPLLRFPLPQRPQRAMQGPQALTAPPKAIGNTAEAAAQTAIPAVARMAAPLPPQIVPPAIPKPVVADPALIEQTADGPLPRAANDGRTPMTAYAPPVPSAKGPRIAVVVTGLGISAKATAAAIAALPGGVTLGFAPYESDVQRWVADARRTGHEVLLEVPMEPYDFPDSDPGLHTLRAAVSEESNLQRLTWSLSRFTGYAGITNLLGGRFLADSDSLAPVMTFIARRGLLFFDSAPAGRSVAPDIARRIGAPYAQSTINLDTIQTAMEIDARLSELEKLARINGSAAGTGFLYPITVERVAAWANSVAGRGFVLVPASALVSPPK